MTTTLRPTRVVGYDILRTVACVMVLVLHASSQMWYDVPPSEADWAAMHIWNTATRAAVPVFFMLSGALFLNAPPPGRKLWTRSIPRLVAAYAVWSVLYGIDNMNLFGVFENPLGLIDQAMVGKFHLWFMPSMIGVYLLMPALYAIAHYEGGWALKSYLWVFAIFGIGAGTIASFEGLLPWALSVGAAKVVPELCKCCGYFLLGYALTRIDAAKLRRWPLVAGFIVAVAGTATAGVLYSQKLGMAKALLHETFALPTAIEAICLFLLARTCRVSPDGRGARIFARLSACTLGIYLLHPFVMDMLRRFGFTVTTLPAWIGVPVLTAVVGLVCLGVIAVIRRIPVVGKWLV